MTCASAAGGGHLELLKWVRTRKVRRSLWLFFSLLLTLTLLLLVLSCLNQAKVPLGRHILGSGRQGRASGRPEVPEESGLPLGRLHRPVCGPSRQAGGPPVPSEPGLPLERERLLQLRRWGSPERPQVASQGELPVERGNDPRRRKHGTHGGEWWISVFVFFILFSLLTWFFPLCQRS